MRYAAAYKPDLEPLGEFIRRKGGINACAGRFSRRLGRSAATGSQRRLAGCSVGDRGNVFYVAPRFKDSNLK
jgi:hypothetical protein